MGRRVKIQHLIQEKIGSVKQILCILLLLPLASWSQDGKVTLSIEPSTAEVGETVLIKIKSQVEGDVDIDNLPSCFVYGYQTMQGMESEMDTYTGDLITYYYFHQTGTFGKEGKYTVGPVYIKKGHKTYKSNTVTVTIGDKPSMTSGDITEQQLKDPAFGIIQVNKTTIYEGQPLLLSAKVYAKFNPTYLDSYQPYSMKGAIDKHGIGNNSNPQTRRDRFKGRELYSFEYDKNVIFPVGTGQFTIDGFSMKLYQGYQNFTLKSNDIKVVIKPLPPDPPADFIGAVGEFDIDRTLEELDLKQGDVFKMIVTISGAGKLQNITEPVPNLPKGFIIYGDPIVEENFNYSSNGAEGSISFEYNVQVSKHGSLRIPETSISYFDISDEKYVSVSTNSDSIQVKKDKNFVASNEPPELEETIEELNILDDLRTSKNVSNEHSFYGSPFYWGSVGAPVIAALLFIFITKRKEQSEEELNQKRKILNEMTEVDSALSELKVHLASNDSNKFFAKVEFIIISSLRIYAEQHGENLNSRNALLNLLSNKGDNELKNAFTNLLHKCDESRFAMSSEQKNLDEVYNDLNSLLKKIRA
jgi:hypothetical protein